jgi:PilZ domain
MDQGVQIELTGVPATKPERRRYNRHRCALPVETRTAGASFPTQGHTTDVSIGGCYVSSRFHLSVGTELDVKLWAGSVALKLKAVVRTSDPGVGYGLQFLNLDEAGAQALTDYFAQQEEDPASTGESSSLRDMLII